MSLNFELTEAGLRIPLFFSGPFLAGLGVPQFVEAWDKWAVELTELPVVFLDALVSIKIGDLECLL
jgi:hypothetical protein